MASIIFASVGQGGANAPADVRVVQRLLNDYIGGKGRLLDVDGVCGPKTLAAITQFQKDVTGIVDGRIDPKGRAIKKLAELHLKNAADGINPQILGLLSQYALPTNVHLHALLTEYWRLLRNP